MKRATFTALTPRGEAAIKTINTKPDTPRPQRFLYGRMYDETVLSTTPYTLLITPTKAFRAVSAMVRNEDFQFQIVHYLDGLGVTAGADYTVNIE